MEETKKPFLLEGVVSIDNALSAFDRIRQGVQSWFVGDAQTYSVVGPFIDSQYVRTFRNRVDGDGAFNAEAVNPPNLVGRLQFALHQVQQLNRNVGKLSVITTDPTAREKLQGALQTYEDFLTILNDCDSEAVAENVDIFAALRLAGVCCGQGKYDRAPLRCAGFHIALGSAAGISPAEDLVRTASSNVGDGKSNPRDAARAYLSMCTRCPFTE